VTAGTNAPDTAKGGASWTNPMNALLSDNAYAFFKGESTDSLALKKFNFNISPNTRQITHVKVAVECKAPHHGANKPLLQAMVVSDVYSGDVWPHIWNSLTTEFPSTDAVISWDDWANDQWNIGRDDAGMLAYGQGVFANAQNFGVYLKCLDMGNDTGFVDQVLVTVWYAGEADSVVLGANTPTTAGYDSVIFCVDTTNTYPNTTTYHWRYAVPYVADATINAVAGVYVTENDSLLETVYDKQGSTYSNPTYASRNFYGNTIHRVYQISAGIRNPTKALSKHATNTWLTPDSIRYDDNYWARYNRTSVGATTGVACYAFGFNIPTTATITGIIVNYAGSCTLSTGAAAAMQLCPADSTRHGLGTAKTFTLATGTTDGTGSLGNKADLWNATLTPAIVNSRGFGVVVYDNNSGAGTIRMDVVTMEVWYDNNLGFRKKKLINSGAIK
jgi:hypothetical protein